MSSTLSTREQSSAQWHQCHRIVSQFERAWQRGERPLIENFLNDADRGVLLELVHTEIEWRRKSGEPVSLISYLIRFPELAANPAALADLSKFERSDVSDMPVRQRLGKYELIAEIGRGAHGVVFRGYDRELDRAVAVKVLKSRSAPESVSDRFLREARSSAQLQHPHIVSLLDAGQHGDDYFLVTTLVEGTTLAEQMQTWKESAVRPGWSEIALLVQQVAEALQYAHRQGVIHRDLKPANILLRWETPGREMDAASSGQESSTARGSYVPLVTDFGLARREEHEATLTAAGEVLGTPAYMSPEQARGEAHRVDGRSDVYSLGVILYQLLTQELPFQGKSSCVLQQVLTVEPRTPRTFNQGIPLDLETICLKAMTKERAGRYQSAGDMANDLGRFLRGEPILARPLGPLGRLVRLARRRPMVAGLAASLAASVLIGLALVSWQWWRAEKHLAEAEKKQIEADDSFRQAFQTVRDLTEFSNHPQLKGRRSTALRQQMLAQALKYFQTFVEQRGQDPTLRKELIQAYFAVGSASENLGMRDDALAALRQARILLEEDCQKRTADHDARRLLVVVHTMMASLYMTRGEGADSLASHEEAYRLLQELLRERPDDPELIFRMGGLWAHRAVVHRFAGRDGEARSSLAEARNRFLCAVRLRPDAEDWHFQLGRASHQLAEMQDDSELAREAFAAYQQACAIHQKSRWPDETFSQAPEYYLALARLVAKIDNAANALPIMEEAHRQADKAASLPDSGPDAQHMLARTLFELGRLRLKLHDRAAATQLFHQAIGVLRPLTRAHFAQVAYRRQLSVFLHDLGRHHHDGGELKEAVAAFQEAMSLREEMLRGQPDLLQLRIDLSATGVHLGRVLEKLDRVDEALSAYRQALTHQRIIWEKGSKEDWHRKWLKERLEYLIALLRRTGGGEEAAALEEERQRLIPQHTQSTEVPSLQDWLKSRITPK